jgi:hypothetical protein
MFKYWALCWPWKYENQMTAGAPMWNKVYEKQVHWNSVYTSNATYGKERENSELESINYLHFRVLQ